MNQGDVGRMGPESLEGLSMASKQLTFSPRDLVKKGVEPCMVLGVRLFARDRGELPQNSSKDSPPAR
jgi:hypothetical protein